jgi:hypothetical protein
MRSPRSKGNGSTAGTGSWITSTAGSRTWRTLLDRACAWLTRAPETVSGIEVYNAGCDLRSDEASPPSTGTSFSMGAPASPRDRRQPPPGSTRPGVDVVRSSGRRGARCAARVLLQQHGPRITEVTWGGSIDVHCDPAAASRGLRRPSGAAVHAGAWAIDMAARSSDDDRRADHRGTRLDLPDAPHAASKSPMPGEAWTNPIWP